MNRVYDNIGKILVVGALGTALYLAPDTSTIARNQFIEFAQNPAGRQEITETLKKIRESPDGNLYMINNLERALLIDPTASISGPKDCPKYPFPLCMDTVGDVFDDYLRGEIGV